MEPLPSEHQSILSRWYIDTRPMTSTTSSLPLLETLQLSDQETIKKYYHLKDKHMSLASYLLKYLFIHRTCRIPWENISISRTPEPHRRPCFIPSPSISTGGNGPIPSIEFNVSHQASLVALAGTIIPPSDVVNASTPEIGFENPNPSSTPVPSVPQVGIDITCVDERRSKTNPGPTTRKELADFVEVFAEVFSPRELETMKNLGGRFLLTDGRRESEAVEYGSRLFYTYWALKEAYIKMTGEALLAPWLRKLEFANVIAPEASSLPMSDWSEPYTKIQTWLYGKKVKDVRIEVVAFEKDYLIATAARGGELGSGSRSSAVDSWKPLEKIDIEKDITPCATGVCHCLEQ